MVSRRHRFRRNKPVIDLMEAGVVHHIEGSMNGPLGDYCSQGKMRGMGVLRSHGGRWQAIQDGEVHIDIAVIAAPTPIPSVTLMVQSASRRAAGWGSRWPIRLYADRVIVVTDNLVPFPACPGRYRATTWITWWKCRRSAIRRRSSAAPRRSRAAPTGC